MVDFVVSALRQNQPFLLVSGDSLHVTATGVLESNLAAPVDMVDLAAAPPVVTVEGVIRNTSSAQAIIASSQSVRLDIAAGALVDSQGAAIRIATRSWASVTNAGDITGDGQTALEFVEQAQPAGLAATYFSLTNSGTITGNRNAIGILADDSQDRWFQIDNSGTLNGSLVISALATGVSDRLRLTNTGTINGNLLTAAESTAQAADQIDNSGRIDGQVRLEGGDDRLTNSGVITGMVNLGDGNDVYNAADTGQAARIIGGMGDDSIYGGSGNDALVGGRGNDVLLGRAGNDTLWADEGADRVDGGSGYDLLILTLSTTGEILNLTDQSRNVGLTAGDTIRGIEAVQGSAHADWLTGTISAEHFAGGAGADSLVGLGGNDTLLGEAGADTLDGGTGDDVLHGGTENDMLIGGDGHDLLRGGAGNDWLIGGAGNDSLFGDAGVDRFVFDTTGGWDIVYDLSPEDRVRLSGLPRMSVEKAIAEYGTMTDLGARLTFSPGNTVLFRDADLDLLGVTLVLI